ncbi:MAG: glycoside hydrolase family 66 protein [Spirochaetota bacterium]
MSHSTQRTFSLYPLVPRLKPGAESIPLRFEAKHARQLPESVELCIIHLDVCLQKTGIDIPKGSSIFEYHLSVESPNTIEEGFGLGIQAAAGNMVGETAIDVGEGPVRYAFVSDFSPDDKKRTPAVTRYLLQNHITHVQFYDWNYRPDQYAPEYTDEDEYADTMGKLISQNTIKTLLDNLKSAGIRALGYGAVYAATRGYLDTHARQGLFDVNGNPFDLIDTFFIMNLDNSQWREHILEQYRYAVEEVGFDGIHMDTYGYPKSGWGYESDKDVKPKTYDLKQQFVSFINQWSQHGDVNIFNNVGGWPADATASAHQHACYIEVWPPHTRYHHLRSLIQNAKRQGKPVILAAYLEPFRKRDEENTKSTRPVEAARLLTAIASSLGATTLLLGEDGVVLTQPYYSDYSRLSEEEKEIITRYYDHQVRFRELLFDPEAEDITESHGLGENREFSFLPSDPGVSVTHDGEQGSIMAVITRSENRVVINLINLIDQSDDLWNADKAACSTQTEVTIQIPKYSHSMRVFCCSADRHPAAVQHLPIREVDGIRGSSVACTIHHLFQWTTIWCELG